MKGGGGGDIRKLVSNGLYREALSLYTKFHSTNLHLQPNNFSYPSLLKACGKLKLPFNGFELHAHVVKIGVIKDVYTATSLTDMYMKVHLLDDAVKLFDEIPDRNLTSTNVMISGLSQNEFFKEALLVFKHIELGGFRPNSVSVASVLSGCENLKHGLMIHGFSVKLGVEMDIYVGTAVMTMYLNCKELVSALRVFILIQDKNVVSYNALISGFLQNGFLHRVLDLFKVMRESLGENPTSGTWVSVLSACSGLRDLTFGKQVHCLFFKYEVVCDVKIGTAFVDMYSKCGCWKEAYEIFKTLNGIRNLLTWNSMISGLMLSGQCEIAVELFEQLEKEGLEPDSASWNSMISGFSRLGKGVESFYFFNRMRLAGVPPSLKIVTSLLPACSALSALQSGKEIHGHTIRAAIDDDEFISTSLVDMYMKCGYSSMARKVFDRVEQSDDPALWNAMISGYGRNGEHESSLEIFTMMQKEGIEPNSSTFVGALSSCSHAGKVDKGWELFRMMSRDYAVNPTSEHISCMVDLLSRSGRLDEARELIREIPKPSISMYASLSSLLGACMTHLNAELGEEMAEMLAELEPEESSPFVILSNIYARLGRWRDVERVRETMKERGSRKLPGCSSIVVLEKSSSSCNN